MENAKLIIADKKYELEKVRHTIDTFYPNWDNWLSDNHKATYNKLVNRINSLEKEIEDLYSQIDES